MTLSRKLNLRWWRKSALEFIILPVKLPLGQYFSTIPVFPVCGKLQSLEIFAEIKHPQIRDSYEIFVNSDQPRPNTHGQAVSTRTPGALLSIPTANMQRATRLLTEMAPEPISSEPTRSEHDPSLDS
jgi:hypothetical protein